MSLPNGPDMRLYRQFSYGNLASFNVLDTRQYRDDQANGDGNKPPSDEWRDPKRTLMGTEQEQWLFENLAASKAKWNVLAQQIFCAMEFRNNRQSDIQHGFMGRLPGSAGAGHQFYKNKT